MTSSRLQHELKQKRPFESLEQETLLNILRVNDQFQNRFGRLFREYGLTSSQYNILRILRGAGEPLPCLEIASRTVQVVPAITGLLDRLEQAGLVRRERSNTDRRVVNVEITKPALALLDRVDGPLRELHDRLLGHMKKSELKELSRLLEKARTALPEAP